MKIKNQDTFEKVKELIAIRKAESSLRLSSRTDIKEKVKDVSFSNGVIKYSVDDLTVVHTLKGGTLELDGTYEIVYSNVRDVYGQVTSEISLSTNESVLLRKVN